jgi:hypothetical protein
MMDSNLTLEEKRAISSLLTVKGFQLLVDKVVKLNRDSALTKMKMSLSDEKLQYSYEFCAWDNVVKALEETPKQIMENLKAEGDEIYG